jgi:hypothetical protein
LSQDAVIEFETFRRRYSVALTGQQERHYAAVVEVATATLWTDGTDESSGINHSNIWDA